jgi:hypothetical protein
MRTDLVFTNYAKEKLIDRNIPESLVFFIFDNPQLRLMDVRVKNRMINVAKVPFKGRDRYVCIIYDKINDTYELVNSFPIRERDLRSRLGRLWLVQNGK